MIDGIIIGLPAIVKASTNNHGDRIVSVEASVEKTDAEGDLILQTALLDSAASFILNGHCDIDHISELGHRFGVRDPQSFIVGKPISVQDIGQKRTEVTSEIKRSPDGIHDPNRNRYDAFWDTFHQTPPVQWRSSIYGYPKAGEVIDCSEEECDGGAWRYLIKGLDWRSLAFTRNPINDAITGYAKIVTAKAFVDMAKGPLFGEPLNDGSASRGVGAVMAPPRNLYDAIGQYHGHIEKTCPHAAGVNSTVGFRDHFQYCCGMDRDLANVYGHALMHHILLERRRR